MPKAIVAEHYITAIQVLNIENWFAVDPCDCYDEKQFPLHNRSINAEKQFLKREKYEQLSNEAKEIILSIINIPEEMLCLFKTKKKHIFSKKVTRNYYRKKWKSKFIVDRTFDEITEWVDTL